MLNVERRTYTLYVRHCIMHLLSHQSTA